MNSGVTLEEELHMCGNAQPPNYSSGDLPLNPNHAFRPSSHGSVGPTGCGEYCQELKISISQSTMDLVGKINSRSTDRQTSGVDQDSDLCMLGAATFPLPQCKNLITDATANMINSNMEWSCVSCTPWKEFSFQHNGHRKGQDEIALAEGLEVVPNSQGSPQVYSYVSGSPSEQFCLESSQNPFSTSSNESAIIAFPHKFLNSTARKDCFQLCETSDIPLPPEDRGSLRSWILANNGGKALSANEMYGSVISSFLNVLLIDIQRALRGPVLVGALRRRRLHTFTTSLGPIKSDVHGDAWSDCMLENAQAELFVQLEAEERLGASELVIFYDENGASEGMASQLAWLLSYKNFACAKYLDGGVERFSQMFPGLCEFPHQQLSQKIISLRDSQANLIQAVWFSHRSNEFDRPHCILPPFLYLGGMDAASPKNLKLEGITHVIRVGFFANHPQVPDVEYHTYILEDSEKEPIEDLFSPACEVIERVRLQGEKVLVHCHAGVSRSATLVLAYMMSIGYKLAEAFDIAFRARPIIRPNEGFGRKLQLYECQLFGLTASTMPLCWMCYDYAFYREYIECVTKPDLNCAIWVFAKVLTNLINT
jgi:protein-tyrosine phosphatase